eukprot:g28301.t1
MREGSAEHTNLDEVGIDTLTKWIVEWFSLFVTPEHFTCTHVAEGGSSAEHGLIGTWKTPQHLNLHIYLPKGKAHDTMATHRDQASHGNGFRGCAMGFSQWKVAEFVRQKR